MAGEALKQKIYDTLKSVYFQSANDLVDVSDGPGDSVHLVIVSRKFDGRRMKDKHDLIWSLLLQHLDEEEWNKISLSVGASPDEVKSA